MAGHGLVKRHSADRRRYEFAILCDQVRRNKERFIRRLQGMVAVDGNCVLFLGSKRNDGYGRLSFRFKGKHTTIDVQRVFLILKLARPIKIGHDAGHEPGCQHKHCVLHVFEQSSRQNGAWAALKEHDGNGVPF